MNVVSKHLIVILTALGVFFAFLHTAYAEELSTATTSAENGVDLAGKTSLSFTVTPPLFRTSVEPGRVWRSTFKISNNNEYDLDVFLTVLRFEATGEEGRAILKPVLDTDIDNTLAGWIELPETNIAIPREESMDVEFALNVPDDAAPGGHYAAIVVGTTPPNTSAEGGVLQVSSNISTLLFVRVPGDVNEDGRIRDFFTAESLYDTTEALFTLRFENLGNVHILPQGDITLYNMWGKVRGVIPVNQGTDFGSVLPDSIRRYEYNWKGDFNVFDIGRYRAVATVTYGETIRQNDHFETSFWVIPIKPLLSIIGALLIIVGGLVWMIRRYIRYALRLETYQAQVDTGTAQSRGAETRGVDMPRNTEEWKAQQLSVSTLVRPLREGIVDLRRDTDPQSVSTPPARSWMRRWGPIVLGILFVCIAGFSAYVYFASVLTEDRDYQTEEVTLKA